MHMQELILFSRADLERSIPSMVDGLKPGQRKIMYCCFKRNIRKDVKARACLAPACPLMPAPMCMQVSCSRQERYGRQDMVHLLLCCAGAEWMMSMSIGTGRHCCYICCSVVQQRLDDVRDLGNRKGCFHVRACGRILMGCPADERQVAQLSGFVSADTAYHHGEASLQSTIIGLAHNFVGSNNINLLVPQGGQSLSPALLITNPHTPPHCMPL